MTLNDTKQSTIIKNVECNIAMPHPDWWGPEDVGNMKGHTRKELGILQYSFIASRSHEKDQYACPGRRASSVQLQEKIWFQPSKLLAKQMGKVDEEMNLVHCDESKELFVDDYIQQFPPRGIVDEYLR